MVEEAADGFILSSRSIDSILRPMMPPLAFSSSIGELVADHGRHAVDGAAAGQRIHDADLDRWLLGKRRPGTQHAGGNEHCAVFHVVSSRFDRKLFGTRVTVLPVGTRSIRGWFDKKIDELINRSARAHLR